MAGTVTGMRWMRAGQLIAMLQSLPEDTFVTPNSVTQGLTLYRGDDGRPTEEGLLGWISLLSEELTIDPAVSDDEWPAIRDTPILVGDVA